MRQFAVSVRASIYDLLQIPRAAEDLLYRGEYVARAARSVAVKVLPTELINLAKEAWIRSHTQNREHVAEALVDGWKRIYNYGTRRQLELDPVEFEHTEDLLRDVSDQLTKIYGTEWRNWEEDAVYPRYLSLVMLNIDPSMYEMDWDDIEELTPDEVGTWDDAALGTSALHNFQALLRDVPPVDRENTIDNAAAKYVALGAILRNLGNFESLTVQSLQTVAQEQMIERQRGDLAHFGVVFDTWFSEQSLHNQGIVADRIERLKLTGVADEEPYRTKLKLGKGGVVEETIIERQDENANLEEEGAEDECPTPDENPTPTPPQGEGDPSPLSTWGEASLHPSADPPLPQRGEGNTLWLRSTKFGDDMDRVLRRRDGRLTYIASDVAYHENKLNRPEGATKLITILGPDHHGYIGRLTAVMAALLRGKEDTPEANAEALRRAKETLEVVIYQLVRFLKEGKPAPMRKRDGNIYELRDLIDELGKNLVPDGTPDEQRTTGRDVARFFYLMRSHDTTMDFDIDLATQQSDENPVFYAQYAHARICSVITRAEEGGVGENPTPTPPQGEGIQYALLTHPRELALIKKILDLPWEVERVAKDYGVHRLTTYAVELARTYHHFYDACRVIQADQPELTRARLALCQATKTALHATFQLLGVSSPERLERREAAPA
jgi:arginyl-tRNA synthetase